MLYSNVGTTRWVVVLLFFFFIDELAFILYNISFFQFMCANTLSLFFNDEIPAYSVGDLLLPSSELFSASHMSNSFFFVSTVAFQLEHLDDFQFDFVASSNSSLLETDHSLLNVNNNTTYYKIKLEATNVKKNIGSFYPLQQHIYTIPGESTLIFYRLENKTIHSLQTLSVYVTTPAEAVAYIKKLQCFCYEELMIAPNSVIDLPILFSIDEEILNEEFKEITINYILLLK